MSMNFNGRIVENKPKFINEQGTSKLTYNFNTDSRLKRGHNFGIIYVTSNMNEENPELQKLKKGNNIPNNRYYNQRLSYDKINLQKKKKKIRKMLKMKKKAYIRINKEE